MTLSFPSLTWKVGMKINCLRMWSSQSWNLIQIRTLNQTWREMTLAGPQTQVMNRLPKSLIRKRMLHNFKVTIQDQVINALYDTGASHSCISHECYCKLPHNPPLKPISTKVVSATGGSLEPVGCTELTIELGGKEFTQEFHCVQMPPTATYPWSWYAEKVPNWQ